MTSEERIENNNRILENQKKEMNYELERMRQKRESFKQSREANHKKLEEAIAGLEKITSEATEEIKDEEIKDETITDNMKKLDSISKELDELLGEL